MIPSAHVLVTGYVFLARRYGLTRPARHDLVADAVAHARALAEKDADEPSALFYALARRQGAFPGLWTLATALYAFNHAPAVGLRVRSTLTQTRPLFLPVLTGALPYEAIRHWFADRQEPLG
jgi:hypothetical protein